jgi:hypothetical protein
MTISYFEEIMAEQIGKYQINQMIFVIRHYLIEKMIKFKEQLTDHPSFRIHLEFFKKLYYASQ